MHVVLTNSVDIAGLKPDGVTSIKINRSTRQITDTAMLQLPSSGVLKRDGEEPARVLTAKQIKRGDFITIKSGYDGDLKTEFVGFVDYVNYGTPVTLECEDWAWLLKQVAVKAKYNSSTVKKVLEDLFNREFESNGEKFTLPLDVTEDIEVNNLIVATETGESITLYDAVRYMQDRYGMAIYFDMDGTLHAGFHYTRNLGDVKYKLRYNTLDPKNIEYHSSDEISVKIRAIYFDKDGERYEAEIGDDDGAVRTIFVPGVTRKTQLRKRAEKELEKYKYNGYKGNIRTLLQPYAEPVMTADIEDTRYPERSGRYFIDETEVTIDSGGARRTIELGIKL